MKLQKDKAWSKPKRMCNHPELIPTHWDQPRPEPTEMVYSCECGENYNCPICGWGAGVYPCSCMRARQAEQELRAWYGKIGADYAEAWEALAKL